MRSELSLSTGALFCNRRRVLAYGTRLGTVTLYDLASGTVSQISLALYFRCCCLFVSVCLLCVVCTMCRLDTCCAMLRVSELVRHATSHLTPFASRSCRSGHSGAQTLQHQLPERRDGKLGRVCALWLSPDASRLVVCTGKVNTHTHTPSCARGEIENQTEAKHQVRMSSKSPDSFTSALQTSGCRHGGTNA